MSRTSVVVARASQFEAVDRRGPVGRRRAARYELAVAAVIALSIAAAACAQDTSQTTKPKDTRQRNRNFGSLARIIYGYSPDGESYAGFGVFQLLPERFFVSFSTEFLAGQRSGNALGLKHNDTNITAGRSLGSTGWLGALSPVIRYQHSSGAKDELAAGMQWEISRTPGVDQHILPIPWKMFIQGFVEQDRNNLGNVNFYNWEEFRFLRGRLNVRLTNSYYIVPRGGDAYQTTQDVIVPLGAGFEALVGHFYQNKPIDAARSTGSQVIFRLRYSVNL